MTGLTKRQGEPDNTCEVAVTVTLRVSNDHLATAGNIGREAVLKGLQGCEKAFPAILATPTMEDTTVTINRAW